MKDGSITRRNLLIASGVFALGAAGTAYLSWQESSSHQPPEVVEPEVDRELIKQVRDIEASYDRLDMSETSVRQEHLELSAELFSKYAGEKMSKEELVESIIWLTGKDYNENPLTAGTSAGVTTEDGRVLFNQDAKNYTRSFVDPVKSQIPWWSALSVARTQYEHEWFHRAGVMNRKYIEDKIDMTRYYGIPLEVDYTRGYAMYFNHQNAALYGADTAMEEVFAYHMVGEFDKKVFGYEIEFRRPEEIGSAAIDVNTGLDQIGTIFTRKPEWIDEFQHYHRESDPIGFGNFLADQSSFASQNNLSGLDLFMGITREPQGILIGAYVDSLR